MCATWISLCLMINACKNAFGLKKEVHLGLTGNRSPVNWEEFVRCQVRANETYSEANRQFSVRNGGILMNLQSPQKWWSTFESAVFGLRSSLPPLVSRGGGLVCESVGKADFLFILTPRSRGNLMMCRSLAMRLRDLPLCHQVE